MVVGGAGYDDEQIFANDGFCLLSIAPLLMAFMLVRTFGSRLFNVMMLNHLSDNDNSSGPSR